MHYRCKMAWFLRCSRVEHVCDTACVVIVILNIACGWPLNHFYSMCEVFLPWVPYGWTIWPGGVHIICSVCSLFYKNVVVCFVFWHFVWWISDCFGLDCDSVYVIRPIELTTDSDPEIFCVFCGSEGGVMKCIWEDKHISHDMFARAMYIKYVWLYDLLVSTFFT